MSSNDRTQAPAWVATLGAIGIVYGDIGTSPLYAVQQCFNRSFGLAPTETNLLGILSLIFWSLFLIIAVKYVLIIMRADNRGEGGSLALVAMMRRLEKGSRWRGLLIAIGILGTALFYCDAMITPAISVLSAIEGLQVATPMFDPYVVPIALAVLLGLFLIQSHGTAAMGRLFGPIMVVWFLVIAALGAFHIQDHPDVLAAIDPRHALFFAMENGWFAFAALGAVVLVVTGGEALYVDMGHFGKRPIRLAWFGLVLPSLLINYFGQGALILKDPSAIHNPFFLMVPSAFLYPLVGLATLATVIASQAVISGVFSLTNQAIRLGFSPRFEVRYTSYQTVGQIYMPQVNWMLMVAVALLVIGFRSSDNLGAAYGIAVTGTMVTTTILACVVALHRWNWPAPVTYAVFGFFLTIDLVYFAANSLKIAHGGWVPLLVAVATYIVISTWIRGRAILLDRLREESMDLDAFVASIRPGLPERIEGTAVYMARDDADVPHALLHNLKHNHVMHERVVLLTVLPDNDPVVSNDERVEVEIYPKRIYRVKVRYGFKEELDVPAALRLCARHGLEIDPQFTSFFVGRVTLVPSDRPHMPRWRRALFFSLARNARSVTDFFHIPPNRVVEMGAQIAL
ncbi:MAG: potassium transporter Kup [Alphaproteobacteria bacterium]|nr:potassium transporter Kup [Alphaproteobacteria bacterium]